MHLPGFYFRGLGMHSGDFVGLRGEGNRMWNISCLSLQLLNQSDSRTFIFNDDRIRSEPEGMVDDPTLGLPGTTLPIAVGGDAAPQDTELLVQLATTVRLRDQRDYLGAGTKKTTCAAC